MTAPDEQPMPTVNSSPSVQGMVMADLETRLTVGIQRYGTALQPFNGRDALRDAYEEALDLACYLRQAIAERDATAAHASPHHYLSTACLHDRHGYCSGHTRIDGKLKVAARCKFCESRCACPCHTEVTS